MLNKILRWIATAGAAFLLLITFSLIARGYFVSTVLMLGAVVMVLPKTVDLMAAKLGRPIPPAARGGVVFVLFFASMFALMIASDLRRPRARAGGAQVAQGEAANAPGGSRVATAAEVNSGLLKSARADVAAKKWSSAMETLQWIPASSERYEVLKSALAERAKAQVRVLGEFSRAIDSLGALGPNSCAAVARTRKLDSKLAGYGALNPPLAGLAVLRQRLTLTILPAERVCQATQQIAAARMSKLAGDRLRGQSECVDAKRSYRSAIALFEAIGRDEPSVGAKVKSEVRKLRRRIKKMSRCTRRDARLRAAANARARKLAVAEAEESRQLEAEIRHIGALVEKCGKKPSPRRAAMSVKLFLYPNAHDPSSVDVESCSAAQMTHRCWKTRCRYRARNGFGALVLNSSTFYLIESREHKYVWLILSMD